MKKLIVPAVAIAAIGGYFYYQNMEPATSEEVIAQEVESAVEEAGTAAEDAAAADVVASNEMMEVEGDIFADAPEHMMDTAEGAEEVAEEAADEMPEEEIDHAEE